MTSPEHRFLLPRVEEEDLLRCVFEDVTNLTHIDRWRTFASSNPTLAREVLKRVCIMTGGNPEIQKKITDEITYVFAALAMAALRLSEQHPLTIVDDDGEDLQPST